jgi:hypothetical protein
MSRTTLASILLSIAASAAAAPAMADDCVDFKWDVGQERALYAGPATALPAAADAKSAPSLMLGKLYELKLLPQDQVTFAATPGKKSTRADSYAGIVTFKIPNGGSYRVSLDMSFWIDVVHDGALVAAADFQGQHGCNSPHKIVVFDLAGNRPFVLQLSNADPQSVRLTITAVPARKL